MRYFFWTSMPCITKPGRFNPSPPKEECRKFLEDRGEIIINESKRFIETITTEQLKNIKI